MKDDLKLFVWEGEGVLMDWTEGMICVLAHDLEEALVLINKKCYYAKGEFPADDYKIITQPEAFMCWGGS